MLPNDPLLALRDAHATMAQRAHEAAETRLAHDARRGGPGDRAQSRHQPAQVLTWLVQHIRTLRRRVVATHG